MTSYRSFILASLAFAFIALKAGSASADWAWNYGSVVCRGNEALIRFTSAGNDDSPEFSHVQTPPGADFDLAPMADPSSCVLSDGRRVRLRYIGLGDGARPGECGADETQIFSVWMGESKIYDREVFHNKCGHPYDLASIWIHGAVLTECRLIATGMLESDDKPTFECRDQSQRLLTASSRAEKLGTLELIRAADGMVPFCKGLVTRQSVWWLPIPPDSWSAYAGADVEQIADIGLAGNSLNLPIGVELMKFGGHSRALTVLPVWYDGPNFRGSYWVVLDETVTVDTWRDIQGNLFNHPDKLVANARRDGVRIFAGDQTAYRTINGVRLNLLDRDGVTWMHAKPAFGKVTDLSDIILRPTADGGMIEVCAFRSVSPI